MRRAVQQISFRRAHLDQLIPPQRKLLRRILSRFRRRDRVRHVARMKPDRPVFSDDILRRAQLKDRARKISFLIHRLMHDVAESVRLLRQTHKLQALLLDHHPAHDGFIRDFDIQRIRFAGRIARFAHEYAEPFRSDEIALRRFHFFDVIHAARHRFRQRHFAVFIGVEGVDFPARRIAHRLRHHVAVAVQQLERRVRQPDSFARFCIRLDELEPISNRLIVDRQNRRVGNVLVAANEDFHGAFERVSRFALHLFQDVQAIRKQLGFGIAVPVGHEIIPLKRPRIVVASGFFEVQLKLRALLRRFNQARIVVNLIVAEEFHDGIHALPDDVELQSLIRHDRRFGLARRTPRIHEEVRVAGFIPDRRGHLDDFIQSRPQLARCGARIVARRRQCLHNRIALFEQHVVLSVPDLRARQHAENRARQLAVAARAWRVDVRGLGQLITPSAVRIVAAVFVSVALIELELHHDGLIRRAKLRRFVRTHRRVQHDFLHDIARRCAALAHDVSALAQRRRNRRAVLSRRHAGNKLAAVFVVFVDVERHALDGISVQPVRFDQPNPALRRLVFRFHGIGFSVLRAVDFGYKTAIGIVFGNARFGNLISAPLQPACFRRTICARRQRRNRLADRTAALCDRQARDRKDCARQRFLRQRIPLHDSDFTVHPVVFKTNVARLARHNRHRLRRIDGDFVARRRADFPHGIAASRKVTKARRAVCARGLRRKHRPRAVHQLKRRPGKHRAIVHTGFAHANSAIRLFKLDAHFLHFGRQAVLRNDDLLDIRVWNTD